MLKDLKTILTRPSSSMLEDAFGVVTLFVLLFAGLHLPVFS